MVKTRLVEGVTGINTVIDWGNGAYTRIVALEEGQFEVVLEGVDGVRREFSTQKEGRMEQHVADALVTANADHAMPWKFKERC